jgi:hypothetical protein
MCRKSTATIPAAWACRNCRQLGPERRGAGLMSADDVADWAMNSGSVLSSRSPRGAA